MYIIFAKLFVVIKQEEKKRGLGQGRGFTKYALSLCHVGDS